MTTYQEARLIEEAMQARRLRIPLEKQCLDCDGGEMKVVGCAITHSIYHECFRCDGTGQLDEKREQAFKAIRESGKVKP